jgi:hypothetical protein
MSDLPNAHARPASLVGTVGSENLWRYIKAHRIHRRKKTRCPGEKPICSFCERLGQKCVYAGSAEAIDEGSEFARNMVRSLLIHSKFKTNGIYQEARISRIEDKLERLVEYIAYVLNHFRRALHI